MMEITSYWFEVLREVTSYWFNVQKCSNVKQLICASCRFPHSYSTYVQFAELVLVPWNKTLKKNILIISCLVTIVKHNNNIYIAEYFQIKCSLLIT